MKSLILAMVFFAVLIYGCYDVKPFKAVRKLVRRPGRGTASLPPMEQPEPPPQRYEPPMRRYR